MKAAILDSDALRAISPAALAAYARGEGWKKGEPFGAWSDIYHLAGRPEIVVPRTNRIGDYSSVVAKLVAIFAEANDRDQISTYRDLVEADRDVVRVRSSGDSDDGSIPIDAGVEIVFQARQLLLAAACAVNQPQSLYRAGANREAIDYLRHVKLGQTEQGSFVVTLLVPVPPQLRAQLDLDLADIENEPFPRQVTRRLVRALEASRRAVELTASGDGARAFAGAVGDGVSANLCEAVAGLIEHSNNLDIMVTWARTRPASQPTKKIAFLPVMRRS